MSTNSLNDLVALNGPSYLKNNLPTPVGMFELSEGQVDKKLIAFYY